MTHQAMKQMREELHISYSQIFTYLACSLKYQFQYVEQRPPESVGFALPFGRAIHLAIEHYYRSIMDDGQPLPFEKLSSLFEECLALEMETAQAPVLFKADETAESGISLGNAMLKAFFESNDMRGHEVVGVELFLSSPLYTVSGELTDIHLVGAIDLLLKDGEGRLLVVDNKTSRQKKSQDAVDDDLQMSIYAYLLASNGYVFPRAEVNCRFDVLRKLKAPTMEHYHTTRTAEHRRRLARIANAVLAGIEQRVFIPVKGWLCADCAYKKACADW